LHLEAGAKAWTGFPKAEAAQCVPAKGIMILGVALQDLETVLTCD